MTSTLTAAGSSTRAWAISITRVRISETGSEESNFSVTTPPQSSHRRFHRQSHLLLRKRSRRGMRLRRTATRQQEIYFKTGARVNRVAPSEEERLLRKSTLARVYRPKPRRCTSLIYPLQNDCGLGLL